MAERRRGLFRANKNKGPSAATAKHPNAVQQSQTLQGGKNRKQRQDSSRGRQQMLPKFLSFLFRKSRDTEGTEKSGSRLADVSTASIECAEMSNYIVKADQVPDMVRIMHQKLKSHGTADVRLFMNIVRMADEHPAGVVITLLRCAPSCDRAAIMMWKTIASSGPTVGKVLPTLIHVMEDWPAHRMFTSDGDDTDVFALAATLALWVMVQVPKCQEAMDLYAPHLLAALFVQIFDSTVHGAEEVNTFWTQCQEQHQIQTSPSSFAVQTLKALLCRVRCETVVMKMGRKHGWDTLLCADTHHYAVGLLAREMRRDFIPLCSRIALHLLELLSMEEPRWDLPALAFLVEVLWCLDMSECGDSVLEIMSRHLKSQCRERRRLALRGFMVLSKDHSMARRMGIVSQRLVELLGDEDGDVIEMTLSVFLNVLQYKDILVSSTTAPKLAEALLPLFDLENRHVQLLSIQLFRKVMESVVEEGKKLLKTIVSQSLLPLFLHCHDENRLVAEASHQTLLYAAGFLKRRGMKQLVKKEKMFKFGKCLLADDRSRAAEHLRQALPYLDSPQESLREAAVRFIGSAGRYLRGQPGELHLLTEALHAMSEVDNPSSTNLEIQAIFGQRAAEIRSSSGFRELLPQEPYQETVRRTPPQSADGAPGTADDGNS